MKTSLYQVVLSVALTSVIVLGGGDVLGLTDEQTVLAHQGNALQNTIQSVQAKVKEAEVGQNEKPSAQGEGQESGLMSDGAAEWIAQHPFTYDDSKTVDENIADAEKLTKEFLDKFGETDQINTPERQRLRKNIADELYGEGAKTKNREVFLIVGQPASGKSTFADSLIAEQGALLVDSDEAKKRLPEFSNGLLSIAVHSESSNIADNVLARAIENGDNIVMPIVGKTYDNLKERVDKFKEAGYTVKLIYIDLPLPKAIERVKKRFKETGRLIHPAYLQSVGLKPKQNYDKLKKTKGVDSYEAWSNDVPRGNRPLLIESSSQQQEQQASTRMGGRGLDS